MAHNLPVIWPCRHRGCVPTPAPPAPALPAGLPAGVIGAFLVGVLAGCSSGTNRAAGTDAATPSVPAPSASTAAPCRTPGGVGAQAQWPAPLPADFPRPPGRSRLTVSQAGRGVVLVRFTTPQPLRSSVGFLIRALPAAGFKLGHGDAEAEEADAPFSRGRLRGIVRLTGLAPCTTQWLVVATSGTGPGTPLLPPAPSTESSPLPFG